MLLFVDESWQTLNGTDVGALGAVAIPQRGYNPFCREFFAMKRDVLGAQELSDSELRGQNCFAKAAFKREELHGDSYWLLAAHRMFALLRRHHAHVFMIWTTEPDFVPLRSELTTYLTKPYRQLLFFFRTFMTREGRNRLASINFDQRGLKEDAAVGTAVQNFLVRTSLSWDRYFIVVPNFSVSAVSPGLQVADVMAHLAAHVSDPSARPELAPFIAEARNLTYGYEYGTQQRRATCVREVRL